MRRVSRIAVAGVATASLAVVLSACGGSSTQASSGGSSKGAGIGLAYDIGGKGDQSFNDAAYAGFQKAEKELKIGGRDIEPQDGESNADKVQRLEQLAKAGYNPVIGRPSRRSRRSTRRSPSASSTTSRTRLRTSPTWSSMRSRPPTWRA
jgi:basic membrane protein A